jgi:TetR/AcrR family transcriptional regulator, transcriptional repressor of aconitase
VGVCAARHLLFPVENLMPRLKEATRAAREARILAVAVRCFARAGYHGTTMDDIASEAGIAKGATYLYFPSKEALFLALYHRWGCDAREAIETALADLSPDERASPKRVLRLVVETTGQHVQRDAALCRVLMEGRTLAAFVTAIADHVAGEQRHGQEQLEDLIRSGVTAGEWPLDTDVPARATLIRATLHGLMATWHAAPGSFDWNAVAAAVVDW